MAFMRRDVNILLLLLIIVSALSFTAFSVYYQTTFKNVSEEYQNKLDQLGSVTEELTSQKQKLNETYSLRVKAEQDREALDEKYQDISSENDRLTAENSNLLSDLSRTKSDLAETDAELEATKVLLSQTQAELTTEKVRRSAAERDLDRICEDYPDHEEC